MSSQSLIELDRVGKRFGGVLALDEISLTIGVGEVHALVGENGAGKSTLGKIVAGVHRGDEGVMKVRGAVVDYRSPHDALADGIAGLAQEIALVPDRSVIENVFLGMERARLGLVSGRNLAARYRELDARVGFGLPMDRKVGDLPLADQQRVEILRALARDSNLIVMDEPTAALPVDDTDRLLGLIARLRDEGITIIYVSHFLGEVLRVADRVTILKDGRLVRTADAAKETEASLVHSMLGRELTQTFPPKRLVSAEASVALEVDGLRLEDGGPEVSLQIRHGEIVGLAGLVGAGRTEVARAIFGAANFAEGNISLDGEPVRFRSPAEAIRRRVAYLPESRKDDGLMMERSVRENVTIAHLAELSRWGFVNRASEQRRSKEALDHVKATAGRESAPVWTLSGGNQQKVLFARWLFERPEVLIVDEPTRGIDVGAKLTIYQLLADLAAQGMAIVLITSEHEEAVGLAHRVLVMRQGAIVAELTGEDINESRIMSTAFAAEEVEAHVQ